MACLQSNKTRQKPRASQATTSPPSSMQNNSSETKGSHLHGEPKRTLSHIFRSPVSTLHMALRTIPGPEQLPMDRIRKGRRKKLLWLLGRWNQSFATDPKDPPDVLGSCCQEQLWGSSLGPPFLHPESVRRCA